MRTVRTLWLPEGQSVIAVARDGEFSHAHYFKEYPNGDHRHLGAYSSPQEVAEEFAGKEIDQRTEDDLRAVGCWLPEWDE